MISVKIRSKGNLEKSLNGMNGTLIGQSVFLLEAEMFGT